ncbi:MAG: tetratricopeptide repeat protein [Deltaproteobacteria bacterium]|nr:tetratricopeptide repeat protein [Deltaproteobacteria bacterium]
MHQAGNLQQAEKIYKEIHSLAPNHGETLHLLAILACQRGQPAVAVDLFQQAIRQNPAKPAYHYNLGNAFKDLGRLAEAVPCYGEALRLKPDYCEALNNLGTALQSQDKFTEAVAAYQQALLIKPNYAEALYNLANSLRSLDRLPEAIVCLQQVMQIKENFPEVYNCLGNIFQEQGKADAAIGCFQHALRLNPQSAEFHFNLAGAFKEKGRLDEAIAGYQKAVELAPGFAMAHNNLGEIFKDCGRFTDAEACLRRALEFMPDYAEAYNNLGNLLKTQSRLTEAEACLRRALELMPDYAEMHGNLGNILRGQGRLTEAEACLNRALELKPDYAAAHANLAVTIMEQGRLIEAETHLRRALELMPNYALAHSNLLFVLNYHPDKSGEEIFAAYKAYDERFGIPCRGAWHVHDNSRKTNRRLKVGYVSPDFRNHSVRYFLEPLLANHNKEVVEVYAYAELATEDTTTMRYKGYVEHWIPTTGLTDDALAERIRADGIDILVDLAGQTAQNRLGVFARKPAPVSLSWLGFCYTTGLTAIDYFLADSAMVPIGSEKLFAEKPWRLPSPSFLVYRPAENMGPVSPLPATERRYVTFGTLTRAIRINHRTIRIWSEILKRVAGSRLVIDCGNFNDPSVQTALAEKFVAHGIRREQLEIGYHSPPWDVLRGMDIGLDCFPHNSGTTLLETLYMGVPFVTLAGRPSMGRIGNSILAGVGHPEWTAWTEDEYVEIAVALASDLPHLAALRAGLREEMVAGPLMNEPAFADKVETAYREMFAAWSAEKSRDIY